MRLKVLFFALALTATFSACESDSQTIPGSHSSSDSSSLTPFEIACKASGGATTGTDTNMRCKCGDTTCDKGLICDLTSNAESSTCQNVDMGPCNETVSDFCSNSQLYTCKEGKWSVLKSCESGCLTDASNCADCTQDSCKDGKLMHCEDRMFKNTSDCPNGYGCSDDGTSCNECRDEETRCENNKMQHCENGKYVDDIDGECPMGCNDTKTACANGCEENQTLCTDGMIQTCENGEYTEEKPCGNNYSCKDEKECGECFNDDTKCDEKSSALSLTYSYHFTCTAGIWINNKVCLDKCSNPDSIFCKDCTSNSNVCINDNNNAGSIIQCHDNSLQPCKNGYSCNGDKCGECTNGTYRCVETDYASSAGNVIVGQIQVCTEGVWEAYIPTESELNGESTTTINDNLVDKSGYCSASNENGYYYVSCNEEGTACGECLNGNKICEGTSMLLTCNSGKYTSQTCPAPQTCKLSTGGYACSN